MSEFNIGTIVPFGGYDWRILDIQGNAALIITENIIEQQSYTNRSGDVTWADCWLREYLNGEFYNKFTEAEQSRINLVLTKNYDNQWYGSKGGEDTKDYIFLLSIEEVVCKYFGDSSKILENRSAKQKYWFGSKDKNNNKRRATLDGYVWWWWLRSPGRDNKRAAYIHGDGNIGIQGNGTFRYNSKNVLPSSGDNRGGVRPALWLNMEL
ncbi:hypothetical protein F8154_13410 [Alkaliphilus pronyensis]|uniref:DUF6273 domain-containing protein n=1 Tax=Alkaliphilus pronyensis TaxID=1482732 RepID=A0A6I0F5E0_9FIRM|nr:DUF6273 domain-containing protein [Alkaliphilus pronyensis]KAB3530913.1 hypothetical protein F8154_13410 [Alkaliphilus pronyensis]